MIWLPGFLSQGGGGLPPVGTALNDCTWEQIRTISDAGKTAEYFSIGDRKAVTLNGKVGILSLSGTYYCNIIGINHNSGREGTNRIHFQFGFSALSGGKNLALVDSTYDSNPTTDAFHMNNSNDNTGGWASSYARNTICDQIKSAMPLELQEALKTVNKYSDNVGGAVKESNITQTQDTVFLLSEYEVVGTNKQANSFEADYQAQYEWYSAGNSKVKYRHNATGSTALWWLRSVANKTASSSTNSFCIVTTAGTVSYTGARGSYGFAPGFCV